MPYGVVLCGIRKSTENQDQGFDFDNGLGQTG